ncbi:hypothetical protein BKA82DRAFT_3961148, partial [Pisolithus tinctorius]
VQERHVWQSLHHVSGLNQHLWESHTIKRWKYKVKWSNALWHVDSHHKLIHWGIVLHAFIDG